mgnify:CR=1 FL=1
MSDNFSLRAIMKTDVKDFTKKFNKMPEQEISKLMSEHRQFVLNKAYKYTGKIIKGEGDAFWITFENVTNAVSCAKEIQLELYDEFIGKYGDEIISLRIVITAGEISYKDGDIFGDAVNLASRIESIANEGEIYLSQSADLLLNKSIYTTESVGIFDFKGQENEVPIYKVNFQYETRIYDQIIVFTDMRNFSMLLDENDPNINLSELEFVLDNYTDIINKLCKDYKGEVLGILADAYLLTFKDIINLKKFLVQFDSLWNRFLTENNNKNNTVNIGIAYGKGYKYKQRAFGQSFNLSARVESYGKIINENLNLSGNIITCTNEVVLQFKENNIFNKSEFIEVKDLSTKITPHEKAIESIKKQAEKMNKDENTILPLYVFVPNPL